MRFSNGRWLLLLAFMIVAVTGALLAQRANASSSKGTPTSGPVAREVKLAGSFTGGQKLCSVLVPNHWRDTIEMPKDAKDGACVAWQNSTGATQHQLGCIFADGSTSLGSGGSATPTPNCGW